MCGSDRVACRHGHAAAVSARGLVPIEPGPSGRTKRGEQHFGEDQPGTDSVDTSDTIMTQHMHTQMNILYVYILHIYTYLDIHNIYNIYVHILLHIYAFWCFCVVFICIRTAITRGILLGIFLQVPWHFSHPILNLMSKPYRQ